MSDLNGFSKSVSLVVCTIGRYAELKRLFDSLTQQTFTAFEIVLVDQNDDVGMLEPVVHRFCDRLRINHVRSERGLSRSRNVGITYVNYDTVAFPDDDCWYNERTLETVAKLFGSNQDLDIITGRTIDFSGRPSVSNFLNVEAPIKKNTIFSCGNSNSMFVRRRVIDQIKGFDERLGVGSWTSFQSGEETDFVLRALDHGCSARFFPELTVFHDQVHVAITNKQIHRARLYGAGFGALLRKHKFASFYVVYRLLRTVFAIFRAAITLRALWVHYKWVWLCAIVRGYLTWPGDS